MRFKTIFWFLAAFVAAGLAGCYESPNVTMHKPGVYKGDKDPLQEKQRSPAQQTKLRERFDLVQKDR